MQQKVANMNLAKHAEPQPVMRHLLASRQIEGPHPKPLFPNEVWRHPIKPARTGNIILSGDLWRCLDNCSVSREFNYKLIISRYTKAMFKNTHSSVWGDDDRVAFHWRSLSTPSRRMRPKVDILIAQGADGPANTNECNV